MSETPDREAETSLFPNRVAYILALAFVIMGVINSTPLIPGWDDLWRTVTGVENLKTRAFATEWFYPIVFSVMMMVVALKHSMWREWRGTSRAWFGAFMDVALVVCAIAVSLTYLIEIDSVCLIDTLTGERTRIMAETLKAEIHSERVGVFDEQSPRRKRVRLRLRRTNGYRVAHTPIRGRFQRSLLAHRRRTELVEFSPDRRVQVSGPTGKLAGVQIGIDGAQVGRTHYDGNVFDADVAGGVHGHAGHPAVETVGGAKGAFLVERPGRPPVGATHFIPSNTRAAGEAGRRGVDVNGTAGHHRQVRAEVADLQAVHQPV